MKALLEAVSDNPFIRVQLLGICLLLDFSDEAGRRLLSSYLHTLLPTITNDNERQIVLNRIIAIYESEAIKVGFHEGGFNPEGSARGR